MSTQLLPEHFMKEDEVFARHPLPWTHQILQIVDAQGRTVIHLGGTPHSFGTLSAGLLCTLAGFIVESANRRHVWSRPSAPGIELPFQTYERITGFDWPGGKSREIIALLKVLRVGETPGTAEANIALQRKMVEPLRDVLEVGVKLVESAYVHVTHGGPTLAQAEEWVRRARQALGE